MEVLVLPHTDLFDLGVQAIAHGCNCLGVMGAGVALQVKIRFPEAYKQYLKFVKDNDYSADKLPGACHFVSNTEPYVFNLMTQYQMGRHAKLEYVRSAFKKMFWTANQNEIWSIGIPQIGAGIGGLVWEDVLYQIEKAEQEEPWAGKLFIAIKD